MSGRLLCGGLLSCSHFKICLLFTYFLFYSCSISEDERNNKLEEQKKNNVYHNLVEGHLIIKQGLVDKRKVGIYLIGLVINMSIPGKKIFSYLTDFSYFSLKQKFWNCRIQSEQVKNDLVEREEDGFSYFHWFSVILNSNQNHPWNFPFLHFHIQSHCLTSFISCHY